MIFNNHSNLEGQHAFLGASKYHWINYDETKVADAYSKFLATQRGTVLHDFACQCITLWQKLPKSQKTLNMYVNDAISFRMVPEQMMNGTGWKKVAPGFFVSVMSAAAVFSIRRSIGTTS